MKPIVHLHWTRGRMTMKQLADTRKAIAMCGARDLVPGQFTAHVDDTTCPACLRAMRHDNASVERYRRMNGGKQ